ncbi:MAG TPA: dTMP kinase [Syntrophorhabdales bacterium]|nr:dTMP kinase [Syntrophorhabdales bacterium]
MFITFEGIEGCGKTTQIDLLFEHLLGEGYRVTRTREPGGTGLGESIRGVLLQKELRVLPLSELLLFMAVRAQHVEEKILPVLSGGGIVLCDRFIDATYAYQGYGRGIDLGIIGTLNRLATKGVMPNLTVLLDCEVEMGLGRKLIGNPQKDRFEKEDVSFHEKIRSAYLKLAEEDQKRFFVVDGRQGIEAIHRIIREKVVRLLESHGV